MKRNVYSSLLAITVICLLSGCSQTYKNPDGGSMTMSGDGKNISIKSGDGKTTVDGTMTDTYPQNLPVPQYPGSKITNNMTINTSGKSGQTLVQLSTKDKPTQILQFYKDKLAGSSWKIDTTVDSPGSASYMGASKGAVQLNVSVIAGDSDTCISISMQ